MRLPTPFRILASVALAVCALGVALAGVAAAAELWSDVPTTSIVKMGERRIVPDLYRTVSVDLDALREQLAQAPARDSGAFIELELPMPYGDFARFAVADSPIMAPALAAEFPELRTWAGHGIDDPTATIRLDLTPAGFHAQVLSSKGSVYIDPYQLGDTTHYQSYYRSDYRSDQEFSCTVLDEDGLANEIREWNGDRHGTELRTYRAAVAATGEYTIYHGGTVGAGMAAITTAMNRVNGVYEREVSIHMELVPNNSAIVYTNPSTDPYTNNNGSVMLNQNQSNLDAIIGSANYDIGHVFSTGGGGIAYLSCVCRTGLKARGVTGLPSPTGDTFYIDYVAHEMGHQYGANHSFNGTAGSCGGGRVGGTAYEPGSGSTIMAYAGICGSHNIQIHSDDYFHWISIQEIVNYTNFGSGNSCPVTTPTGAIEPVVDAGSSGFYIPLDTPFELTASATTTGTPTYCWEESDLGPGGHPNAPSGNAPIFRSFDPVDSPTRSFPKLSDILLNTQTIGEILPSYVRNLSFKVTVRDFQAGGVGVSNDGMSFHVDDSGPFLVTEPDASGVTWSAGAMQTVSWDVAGTNVSPVNCATVNILCSVDGGVTYPYTLASGTPNDGFQQVTAPNVMSSTARVRVEAADNVFFDISNHNFEIQDPTGVADLPLNARPQLLGNQPNPFGTQTTLNFVMPRAAEVSLEVYDLSGRLVQTLLAGESAAGNQQVVWDGTDIKGNRMSAGVYLYRFQALGTTEVGRMTLLR